MAEDHKAADAVEAAAEAIEKIESGKGKLPSRVQNITSLALAAAAVITSFGAFGKTCDHSVTESAYNTLAANISKLSDNQEKLGQDVANMHGYLEGIRAPLKQNGQFSEQQFSFDAGTAYFTAPTVVPFVEPPRPPPPHAGKIAKPAPSSSTTLGNITWDNLVDSGVITFAVPSPAPTLAPASPPPAPVTPPPFAAAVAK
jgi:hypothetical protein